MNKNPMVWVHSKGWAGLGPAPIVKAELIACSDDNKYLVMEEGKDEMFVVDRVFRPINPRYEGPYIPAPMPRCDY